eukprot:12413375-Karenia_brevis.AAC.1
MASRFHEWSFRTMIRMTSAKTEDRAKTMGMIIEGLRGDAGQIAIDLGPTKILGEKGLDDLTKAIRQH